MASVTGYFMLISATVNVDLSGLNQFRDSIDRQLKGEAGPISDCIRLWAVRYRSYAQLRFDTFSKGGGDWKPLSFATIKARRSGKAKKGFSSLATNKSGRLVAAKKQVAILKDTGILFAALQPVFVGTPGALEEKIAFGIRVGYGGPMKHDKGGRATIADIASFHQNGAMPRMPAREIIVKPPDSLLNTMAEDMSKAMGELSEQQ